MFKGIKLYGKVQVVENFPDIKVKVDNIWPDLKVKIVEHFPNTCGKWQIVEHFPDFKIQFVDKIFYIKMYIIVDYYKYIPMAVDKMREFPKRFGKWIRDAARPRYTKHLCVVADLFQDEIACRKRITSMTTNRVK